MITTTDQMNRHITLADYPGRIISVVPSQTELLYSLGLDEQVIGITKFCVHPDHWFRNKIRVGGTKKLNIERIQSLQPDLIIANKEENNRQDIERLSGEFPVWISDIKTLDQAVAMISEIGRIVDRENNSLELSKKILDQFNKLKKLSKPDQSCIYLIWKNPFMAAGVDTFISEMLGKAGFKNLLTDPARYPEISLSQIVALKPDVIFLSSEPFPFKEKDADELRLLFPNTRVICVDGEMFSWYGSRLLQAPEYFASLAKQLRC